MTRAFERRRGGLAAPSLLAALLAAPAAPGCAPEAPGGPDDTPGSRSVIVAFQRHLDPNLLESAARAERPWLVGALRDEAERAQAGALELLRRHGLAPRARLWSINALAVSAPPAVLAELAALPGVVGLRPDEQLRRLVSTPTPERLGEVLDAAAWSTPFWNLAQIGAPALWAEGHRGEGVTVASVDTGVDGAHPALARSFGGAASWFDPYGQRATPTDLDGHGTRTMGLIGGAGPSGRVEHPIGVAPAVRWIAARIYDDAGRATYSAIHEALQWLLDPDGDPATDDAPDVVNGSWGFDELAGQCVLEFEPDLAALRAAGTAVVFSAGNSGPGPATSTSPGNNPSAFAVGALDRAAALDAASSRGPGPCGAGIVPALVAPGIDVYTTDRTLGGLLPDSYALVSGTSYAAPHVAGAMALLRGIHPSATPAELERALVATARDLGPPGPDGDFGYGALDLPAARRALDQLVAARLRAMGRAIGGAPGVPHRALIAGAPGTGA